MKTLAKSSCYHYYPIGAAERWVTPTTLRWPESRQISWATNAARQTTIDGDILKIEVSNYYNINMNFWTYLSFYCIDTNMLMFSTMWCIMIVFHYYNYLRYIVINELRTVNFSQVLIKFRNIYQIRFYFIVTLYIPPISFHIQRTSVTFSLFIQFVHCLLHFYFLFTALI